jgi:hypothetical protein
MKRFVLATAVLLGVLIPVTFVPAQRNDPAGDHIQQLPPVRVQLVASGDSVAASPDSVSVKRRQRVEWTSNLGDWEVIFTSDQPFGPQNRIIRGKKDQAHGRPIQSLANLGPYKYDIRITLPDGTVLTADPEIVVEAGEREGE